LVHPHRPRYHRTGERPATRFIDANELGHALNLLEIESAELSAFGHEIADFAGAPRSVQACGVIARPLAPPSPFSRTTVPCPSVRHV
jgi:hypothetical protein